MSRPRRYLLVGAGVAGYSAAEAIRRHDPTGQITLISDEPHPFYSRPGLAFLLTGELPEKQLFLPLADQFEHRQSRVVALDPRQHQLTLDTGNTLIYDRLLLATGSRAVRLTVPGATLEGVVTLDNLADARRIIHLSRRAKHAVVVGGGITALELVEGLRAQRVNTHYLLRGDRYWSGVLDTAESVIIKQRLAAEGVSLHHRTQLARILGKNNRVRGIETQSGEQIQADIVAVAVGVTPNRELAALTGLQTDRGILVNEYLQTSHPDIFAAGDAAQVYDPLTGATGLDTLWPVARAQGSAAGQNMTGAQVPYHKTAPLNVTRLTGLTTAIIGMVGVGDDEDAPGIVRGESETWRQLPNLLAVKSQFEVNRLRLMLDNNTLMGAVVMGDQTLTRPLYHLITRQIDLTPVIDRLLNPTTTLADHLIEFWTTWSKRNEA